MVLTAVQGCDRWASNLDVAGLQAKWKSAAADESMTAVRGSAVDRWLAELRTQPDQCAWPLTPLNEACDAAQRHLLDRILVHDGLRVHWQTRCAPAMPTRHWSDCWTWARHWCRVYLDRLRESLPAGHYLAEGERCVKRWFRTQLLQHAQHLLWEACLNSLCAQLHFSEAAAGDGPVETGPDASLSAVLEGLDSLDMVRHGQFMVRQAVQHQLCALVAEQASDVTVPLLATMRHWLHQCALPWCLPFMTVPATTPSAADSLPCRASPSYEGGGDAVTMDFCAHWEHLLVQVVYEKRCAHLFDIIVDYPDSEPALRDLKACIDTGHASRRLLVSYLSQAIRNRLLQPGAKTMDILHHYVSTIKCLLFLDSSGLLSQSVIGPIRAYLRDRDDTVRCIVQQLFDSEGDPMDASPSELFQALKKPNKISLDEDLATQEDYLDPDWEPVPADLGHKIEVRLHRDASDVLNALVNVYDTLDVFVQEFQQHLCSKLLSIDGYDQEREVANLEMLKCRFGESAMQSCQIMIRDIESSRRLHAAIHEQIRLKHQQLQLQNSNCVQATVVSHLFWPNLAGLEFQLPDDIQRQLEAYSKQYEVVKRSRKLKWIVDRGKVDVELFMAGESTARTFQVPPLAATLIYHFQRQDRWTLDELAAELRVQVSDIRSKVRFWVAQGILEMQGNHVSLRRHSTGRAEAMETRHTALELAEPENSQQTSNELALYQQYIIGMLTNLGALPLERIQMMLKMFVQSPKPYNCAIEELEAFLNGLVRDQVLDRNGTTFKLHAASAAATQ